MKMVCRKFQPLKRNTLVGFAEVHLVELDLTFRDVAIHTKNGREWAQPPARPQIRDGVIIKDEAGKIAYYPICEFGSREARDRFSAAVIAAILANDDGKRALGQSRAQDKPAFNDEIGF
jgi:hypothetical protein